MSAPLRVFLVDDSAVVRGALRRILEKQSDIAVVGTAPNGKIALEAIPGMRPDVVLMDIEMPEMDGLTTLPPLLAAMPGLRVIMASSLTRRGAKVTMDCLAAGAVDYITKPTSQAGPDALAPMAEQLVAKVRGFAPRRPSAAPAPSALPERPARLDRSDRETSSAPIREPVTSPFSVRRTPVFTETVRPTARAGGFASGPMDLIAIASSTGGPNALAKLLSSLPKELRTPIIITQHMPPLFTQLLAQRLERESGRPCAEATDGMRVEVGKVYIAPGDHHLLIEPADTGWKLRLNQGPPEHHCRPSADPMFRSVAQHVGARAVAVVLTGMGEDGARGAVAIRNRGGRVLAQDEASSVVWGMPGATVALGAADLVLPVPDIAQRLATLELVPS